MKKQEQLESLRQQWEGDMEVITTKTEKIGGEPVTMLVVLKEGGDVDDPYRCHRYFVLGFGDDAQWQVSVDGDCCHEETVMRWLCEPSAMTCRQAESV